MRPIAPAAAANGSRPSAQATRSSSSSATSHPTSAGRLIRSLLLGYYDKDGLRYAGRVGTGWGQKRGARTATKARRRRAQGYAARQNPAGGAPPQGEMGRARRSWSRWISAAGPAAQLVRQGSLKGVREDKPAKQVVREVEQMPETATIKQAALRQKIAGQDRGKARIGEIASPVAGCRRRLEPSRPGLLGGRRRHQADAGRILHRRSGTGCDRMSTDRVLALVRCPDGASRAVLLPEARLRRHRRQASEARAGRRRQVDRGRERRGLGVAGPGRRAGDPRPRLEHRPIWRRPTAWCSISIPAPASNGRMSSLPPARCGSGCAISSSKASSRPPAARVCMWCCRSSRRPGTRPRISAAAWPSRWPRTIPTASPRRSRRWRGRTASSSTICATAARRPRSRPIRRGRGRAPPCRRR